jgi:DNA-binding NarL/FixJ family response regulator
MTEREPPASRLLVIDDHELVSASLVIALADRGLTAHGCPVADVADILRVAERIDPTLVLLDLDLWVDGTRLDEIALLRAFRARRWLTLIVSGVTDPRRLCAAVAAGAVGVVGKSARLADLLDTVCTAAAGRSVLSEQERAQWLDLDRRRRQGERRRQSRLKRLTARERQVLERLARGERALAIADEFVVSLTTVRSQIRSILTKLDVNSQLEAVALLREEPQCEPPQRSFR